MAFKLDDLLGGKKETTQILDLSRSRVTTKEDFDKVRESKVRLGRAQKLFSGGQKIRTSRSCPK